MSSLDPNLIASLLAAYNKPGASSAGLPGAGFGASPDFSQLLAQYGLSNPKPDPFGAGLPISVPPGSDGATIQMLYDLWQQNQHANATETTPYTDAPAPSAVDSAPAPSAAPPPGPDPLAHDQEKVKKYIEELETGKDAEFPATEKRLKKLDAEIKDLEKEKKEDKKKLEALKKEYKELKKDFEDAKHAYETAKKNFEANPNDPAVVKQAKETMNGVEAKLNKYRAEAKKHAEEADKEEEKANKKEKEEKQEKAEKKHKEKVENDKKKRRRKNLYRATGAAAAFM